MYVCSLTALCSVVLHVVALLLHLMIFNRALRCGPTGLSACSKQSWTSGDSTQLHRCFCDYYRISAAFPCAGPFCLACDSHRLLRLTKHCH